MVRDVVNENNIEEYLVASLISVHRIRHGEEIGEFQSIVRIRLTAEFRGIARGCRV